MSTVDSTANRKKPAAAAVGKSMVAKPAPKQNGVAAKAEPAAPAAEPVKAPVPPKRSSPGFPEVNGKQSVSPDDNALAPSPSSPRNPYAHVARHRPEVPSNIPDIPAARSVSSIRRAGSARTSTRVSFAAAEVDTVEVPTDQQDSLDIFNVYSPVRYVSRKEQRTLEAQRRVRIAEILDYCSHLFEGRYGNNLTNGGAAPDAAADGASNQTKPAGTPSVHADPEGHDQLSEDSAAAASFIMSIWPEFPVELRPSMSIEVERAFPKLYHGSHLCIFNEELAVPTRCTAALRLLRNLDGDEGSIAIYNTSDLSSIDGYIPLSFLHSVTRGLESIERQRYVRDGAVRCHGDDGKIRHVSYSRAFTLHCRAPQKFYVSFIAFNDHDLDLWMRTLSYFVFLSSQCRAYYSAHDVPQ